jgi:hypothetical protein
MSANYQRNKVARIVNRARTILNQVPFAGEDTSIESNIAGSPTTRHSDEELIDYVNRAERAIIAQVKACHAYPNIVAEESSVAAASTTISTPTYPVFRVMRSRVLGLDGVRARQRAVDSQRRLARSGLQPTAARPVFTYEDGEVMIYPTTGEALKTFKYYYVRVPAQHTALSDVCNLDQRFEAAMVWYVASMAAQKHRRRDLHAFAFQVYQDELTPYARNLRTNLIDDDEVEVE